MNTGPIAVYTIEAGPPKGRDYTVTLSTKIHFDDTDGLSIADFERHLQYIIEDWSDGRYPFDVEQLRHGLKACVERAIYKAVEERECNRYAGEYYVRGNSKTAKWVHTTRRAYKRIIWWLNGTLNCKIF